MDAARPSTTCRRVFASLYAIAVPVFVWLSWFSFDRGSTDLGGVLALAAAASTFFAVLLFRGKGDFLVQPLGTTVRRWQLWLVLIVSTVNVLLQLLFPRPHDQSWVFWYWVLLGVVTAVFLIRSAVLARRKRVTPPA